MAKKTIAKKLPAYKKITDDDLKILYAIKEQMIKDREENISPQQKMLIQVSDFIIDSNADKLTATMISKALREIGVSIGSKSIKSFLLSRGQEPYRKVKNQAQKIAKNEIENETKNETIKETQKVEIKEAQIEDEKEIINEPQKSDSGIEKIEDIKEVKKDDPVIAEEEMKKLEEEIKSIETENTLSVVRKHEKIESLKDNSIAALKRGGAVIPERPQGMTKNEYMSSISRTREEAAENRTKKKNF